MEEEEELEEGAFHVEGRGKAMGHFGQDKNLGMVAEAEGKKEEEKEEEEEEEEAGVSDKRSGRKGTSASSGQEEGARRLWRKKLAGQRKVRSSSRRRRRGLGHPPHDTFSMEQRSYSSFNHSPNNDLLLIRLLARRSLAPACPRTIFSCHHPASPT
ncbi:hypothetical protein C1H76_7443 [Elsinoe australis]|uniref:Uncharacterized protein n=1 Tax=Elsinoe australis TaxID=40998 RepID=A0A4U7AZC5_9PEZI|nr:hypothetical protein C1H76_7443 [Elsinoe australis]